MTLIVAALTMLLVSAGAALLADARQSPKIAAAGVLGGGLAGLIPAIQALAGVRSAPLTLAWSMPGGTLSLGLDPISAWFLVPTLLLCMVSAVYGIEYLAHEPRPVGPVCCCFNLLAASMVLVLIAQDALLFLLAWECMALTSFFLVAFEHDRAEVRTAAWMYLVASHLGTACLLAMFVLMGDAAGSFAWARMARVPAVAPGLTGLLFVLGVIGFGTKAGFVPLHVWLPEAHPAAPSHVSAVMSGVMIKTGVYGLVRLVIWLGPAPAWWGWLLVGIGVSSGVLGVLYALAQHDIKRLLAYHSVENIGIITLGLGLGVLGIAYGVPALTVLGFAGGLLHVLNHALFKGLLFLASGAVLHAVRTREIDRLGGLLRRMPWTGCGFLVGAAAICGLPPLNGFVSEFLIYLGAFGTAAAAARPAAIAAGVIAVAALALIGGLAVACFTKAFGIMFLGEPRTAECLQAEDAGVAMRVPMLLLAVACVLVGLLPAPTLYAMTTVLVAVTGQPDAVLRPILHAGMGTLTGVALVAVIFLAGCAGVALARRRLLAGRAVAGTVTWDCGYAAPTGRMQYTASSFAEPLTSLFGLVLRTRTRFTAPAGWFPREALFHTHAADAFSDRLFRPAFAAVEWALDRLRVLQHGRIQVYVLYIVVTLIGLIVWKLR